MRASFRRWSMLLTISMWSFALLAQRPHIHFEHLTSSDGLADNTINVVKQDSRGFLWIGTQDGLNRFDGYNYRLYERDTSAFSLTNNTVDCIYENKEGDLWIGTFEGVNIYERKTGRIRNYLNDSTFSSQKLLTSGINDIIGDDKGNYWLATGWQGLVMLRDKKILKTFQIEGDEEKRLPSNTVTTLSKDGENFLWVGTTNGFCRYDLKTHRLKTYFLDGDPLANSINKIIVKEKHLWIGTKTGLVRFNKETETFDYFITNPLDPLSFINRISIKSIVPEGDKLWLATEKKGIFYFDINTGSFFEFTHESNCNLSSNEISCIFKDNAGTMWVGTHAAGLNFSNYQTNMFTNWLNTGINENGLGTGPVSCFHESSLGDFWVGVNGGGINRLDDRSHSFIHYESGGERRDKLSNNSIVDIIEPFPGKLWLATFGGGINIMDLKTDQFEYLTERNSGLPSDQLSCLLQDSNKNIWIGTSGNGLVLYNPETDIWNTFSHDHQSKSSISDDIVNFVFEDQKGHIWVGTYGGLNLFSPEDSTFIHYKHEDSREHSISNNAVTCMKQDSKGNLWVGTAKGLNLFDPVKKRFTSYTKGDGLSSNLIYSIEEDNSGHLWVSTDDGICRYQADTKTFLPFDETDGVKGKEFQQGGSYKNSEGILFFGGANGYTAVDPTNIADNTFAPPVFITKLRIHYIETTPLDPKGPLVKSIEETDTLFLSYKQSVLTFEFSALNYVIPENNQYKYWLEGFHDEDTWHYTGNIRNATYTNLDPGIYKLHIVGANNDGLWSKEERILTIVISPPFWKTWWFRSLTVVALIAILILIYRLRVRQIKIQNRILEQKVVERTEEIRSQKEHIEEQKNQILVQKEHMEDNIEVAKMVQMAVLPAAETLQERFGETFLLFLPKDVVSGDFYWFLEKGDRFYLAAADCTGHGVAGGFLTMIGYNHLTEIVNQYNEFEPGEILDELNQRIIHTLRQRQGGSKSQDGMDISLAIFEKGSMVMKYAGAVNPIFVIRPGEEDIIKLETDYNIIGSSLVKRPKPFKSRTFHLREDDLLYFFSDGYPDQFGGPEGIEKLKKSRFKNYLLKIQSLPMEEQMERLSTYFQEWRGDVEQFDDILVVGIKVGNI